MTDYMALKAKLNKYYMEDVQEKVDALREKCFAELDKFSEANPGLNAYQLKAEQYDCIVKNMEPIFFEEIPFYFEFGSLHPFCNGLWSRGGIVHANGWVRQKFLPEYEKIEGRDEYLALCGEKCVLGGSYLDVEHFKTPFKKIFAGGLSSVYEEAKAALDKCENDEERDFLNSAMRGLLALKRLAEKCSDKAYALLENTTDEKERESLTLIAETAKRVPWNKPETLYEGLATMAFMRKGMGSIEGIGFNSFGRVDVHLYPLYEKDKARGVSDEVLYDYISKFLLIWDAHVDKTKIMSGYGDYEYENALTIGGCDIDGNEVFNKITEFILTAHSQLDNMYPKIKCRYSGKSSPEYLTLISKPILSQKSILLYCNDDVNIPSLERNGFLHEHAYDYDVTGCWGLAIDDYYKEQGGQYLNTLRALEWSMYMPEDKLRACGLDDFKPIANLESFEEVYDAVVHNVVAFAKKKAEHEARGCRMVSKAFPVPLASSFIFGTIEKRKDYTNGGGTYNWENFLFAALPDTIDSLLAIKNLCFDKKLCTLKELIEACRNNWSDEKLRSAALASPSYGDSSEESSKLFGRFVDDVYNLTRDLPTSFGGKWQVGSYMYTEIIWWGKMIKATPNGRRDGDFLSQGLTPSRLHKIDSVTDVFSSLRYYDAEKLSQGTVINIILPTANISEAVMDGFLRGCAASGASILQINCVSREDLLAAQKDPQKYAHIIVRVTGFSAQFIMLSEDFQNEFLSRNYYV